MSEEPVLKQSSLCQTLIRDGKSIEVHIYTDGSTDWLLEVVDEHGNSVVWDDFFVNDQDALDEVLRTVDEEGIDALIGLPSGAEPRE